MFFKGMDKFVLGELEVRREFCNGGGEGCNGRTIRGSCRGEVGNCFNGLCFKRFCVRGVGAVDGAGCGLLGFLPIVVAFGKKGLEAGPVFCEGVAAFPPIAAVVVENTGGLYETVGRVDYLLVGVWGVCVCGEVDCVLNLLDEDFKRLVGVVRFGHAASVFEEVGQGDFGVGGVQMFQHLEYGEVSERDVRCLDGCDVNLVDAFLQLLL